MIFLIFMLKTLIEGTCTICGGFNEYIQSVLDPKISKNRYTPVNPGVGLKGVYFSWTCFPDEKFHMIHEIFNFNAEKNLCILHGQVFVMWRCSCTCRPVLEISIKISCTRSNHWLHVQYLRIYTITCKQLTTQLHLNKNFTRTRFVCSDDF